VTYLKDIRFALRQLHKTPVFTLIVVLTLALGIGANTAVFSVMDAVLYRSLPVQKPNGLFYMHMGNGEGQPPGATSTGDSNASFSMPVFTALRARKDIFSDLISFAPLAIGETAVRLGKTPLQAEGEEVSGNYFSGLTAGLAVGRGVGLADELTHAPVIVLSYAFWTRQFARNPKVLGQTVYVKGVPFTVIGVGARGFFGVEPATSTDFWIPLQNRPDLTLWGTPPNGNTQDGSPGWWSLRLIARLKAGVTSQQAQEALTETFQRAAEIGIGSINPREWKPLLEFDPARGIAGYSDQLRQPVLVLMGLVLMVLLIAVTNVGLMIQARNAARAREFSLRLALGAGRARLLSQLMAESMMLVSTGALLGWLFAVEATKVLTRLSQIETGLSPNSTVLWFTLGISGLAALAFGLAPLRAAICRPVADVLHQRTANLSPDRRRVRAGNVLMAAQIAICVLLLMSAGLLLRTLRHYQDQPLGMAADELLVFGLTPDNLHGTEQTLVFYRTLLDKLRVLPGVQGATLVENRPGGGWSDNGDLMIDGVEKRGVSLRSNIIGSDYFAVVGTPMRQGRDFTGADDAATALVAIVNQTLAKRYFPHGDANGHHLGGSMHSETIIGVVQDSRYTSVDESPTPTAYYPVTQGKRIGALQIELRTKGAPMALLSQIRNTVRSLDPNLPLEDPITQRAQFALSYAQPTLFATLGGFFGGLAALLVMTGLYGTLAYRIGCRTSEIGVRMALGAQRRQVVWLVVRDSLLLAAAGVALGIPLVLLGAHFLGSMVWKLSPFDPTSMVLAIAGVALVVAAASLVPAMRAASVDPMRALRTE
jgi:predicted permease